MGNHRKKCPRRSVEFLGEPQGLRIRTEKMLIFRDSDWVIYFQKQKIFLTRQEDRPEEEFFVLLTAASRAVRFFRRRKMFQLFVGSICQLCKIHFLVCIRTLTHKNIP